MHGEDRIFEEFVEKFQVINIENSKKCCNLFHRTERLWFMTDIKDRIQKAIQLHNEGASSFSLAVIKLTFGISDPIQKKMILKAYQTGTAPCIDQEEEKKETKTSDDIASTLQQALEENAGKKTSAAFQFIDKPGKRI